MQPQTHIQKGDSFIFCYEHIYLPNSNRINIRKCSWHWLLYVSLMSIFLSQINTLFFLYNERKLNENNADITNHNQIAFDVGHVTLHEHKGKSWNVMELIVRKKIVVNILQLSKNAGREMRLYIHKSDWNKAGKLK